MLQDMFYRPYLESCRLWRDDERMMRGLLGKCVCLRAWSSCCRWDKWTGDAMMDLLELETSLGMLDGRTGACQWQKPDLASAALLR